MIEREDLGNGAHRVWLPTGVSVGTLEGDSYEENRLVTGHGRLGARHRDEMYGLPTRRRRLNKRQRKLRPKSGG